MKKLFMILILAVCFTLVSPQFTFAEWGHATPNNVICPCDGTFPNCYSDATGQPCGDGQMTLEATEKKSKPVRPDRNSNSVPGDYGTVGLFGLTALMLLKRFLF